eukprot:2359262-Amphidinium_carterae.2
MSAQTGVVRPVPLTIIVIGCILLLQGTVFTAHLTFPSEPEVWLPTNHMFSSQCGCAAVQDVRA